MERLVYFFMSDGILNITMSEFPVELQSWENDQKTKTKNLVIQLALKKRLRNKCNIDGRISFISLRDTGVLGSVVEHAGTVIRRSKIRLLLRKLGFSFSEYACVTD